MKHYIGQFFKRYWSVIVVLFSILSTCGSVIYARGMAVATANDEFKRLQEIVHSHVGPNEAETKLMHVKLYALEQKTEEMPQQLRDIQKRLAVLEGKSDMILKMLEKKE